VHTHTLLLVLRSLFFPSLGSKVSGPIWVRGQVYVHVDGFFLWGPLRVTFACLLTCSYTLLFQHWSAAPHDIWIYYIQCLPQILDSFFVLFPIPRNSALCLLFFISLTDHWWTIYSCGVFSANSVHCPLSACVCCILCLHFSWLGYCTRLAFLCITSLYYSHKYKSTQSNCFLLLFI